MSAVQRMTPDERVAYAGITGAEVLFLIVTVFLVLETTERAPIVIFMVVTAIVHFARFVMRRGVQDR